MAFVSRGGVPSMEKENIRKDQDYNFYDGLRDGHHMRMYYYVAVDNTYIIIQMIMTFIILMIGVITLFFTYKSTIIDPIENIKKFFINSYLIIIGVLLAINLIINFFSKSEIELIRRLKIFSIISISIMFIFFGIKLNLDTTYNKYRFEQFYNENNISKIFNEDDKSKIDIGLNGIKIKTEKEYYIDECSKLYNIFSTKAYGTLGIHLLLNILLIYQISRISKIKMKKERLNKDDLILFYEK